MKQQKTSHISVERSEDYAFAVEMRAAMSMETGLDHDRDSPGWRERMTEFFSSRQARGDAEFFVARDESGERIGTAFVTASDHYRTHAFGTRYATVHGVYVKPEYRRRGVASRLMAAVENWAREKGYDVLRLRSSEMGQPLYVSLGFTPTTEVEKKLRGR